MHWDLTPREFGELAAEEQQFILSHWGRYTERQDEQVPDRSSIPSGAGGAGGSVNPGGM